MPETVEQYKQRILGYSEGTEPLEVQASTPDKLATLLRSSNKEALTRRPAANKWSVTEIVAHFADAEIAISWRIRQILSKNTVPIQAYDQEAWASTFDYAHRNPETSLALFRALRSSNIELLKSVGRELWDNYGVHEERGNESVTHLVRMIAGHDLNHLRQIEAILK